MKLFTKASLVLGIICYASFGNAQLTVNNTVNATDGVQNILLGEGVTVSNITFSGTNEQIGSFNCTGACNLGIGSGLIMATGNIDQTPGNGTGNSSMGPASGWGASDADLVELSGNTINDAAVLQFDFVATGNTVSFDFVFGSEEYPEYVNSVNDAFGFFLSGPGISGPFLNNATNIALIPGTSTPVTINTVNPGLNSTYYIANSSNANVPECDGFTTVLTAFSEVECGGTYHIKLAIGDASDTGWDSFVFLKGNSFESNEVSALLVSPSYSPPGGGLYEGCQIGTVSFTMPSQNVEQIFDLDFSGIAQYGIDYDSIPTQIIFPANQTQLVIDFEAITDEILEGVETFTITVLGATSCGEDVEVEITLSDLPELIVSMPDVPINCGQEALMIPQISGGLGNYLVDWADGPIGSTLSVYPDEPTSYAFTVTDTCGVAPYNGVANVTFIQNAPVSVNIGPDQAITCLDDIVLNSNVSGGYGNYSYQWTANGINIGNGVSVNYQDDELQNISLTVTDECDEAGNDAATVTFPAVPISVSLGSDMSVTCLDETLFESTVSGGVGNYSYTWSTQLGNLGNTPTLLYQTDNDVTIVLQIEDECGNMNEDEIAVAVPQIAMAVDLGTDLTVTCIDLNTLAPDPSGGVGTYSYIWNLNGQNVGFNSTYNLQTNEGATLILTVEDECGNSTTDEIEIAVPPVPVSIDAGTDLVVTCIDESDLAVSVSGGVGAYSYQWEDELNTISLGATTSYQANQSTTITVTVTDECGNSDTDQLYIDVPAVAVVANAGADLSVTCIDVSQLSGSATGGIGDYSYEWTDTEGLIGSSSTTTYQTLNDVVVTFTVIDECGNSDIDELFVAVPLVPVTISISNDTTICYGESATFHALAEGGVTELVYTWNSVEGSNFNYQHVYPTTSEQVTVQAEDACGNSASTTAWVTVVDVHPRFIAEYINNNTVAFTNLTIDAAYMDWHFSDGDISHELNPVHQFTSDSTWSATLVATAELGCTRSITQEYAPLGDVFVPNCFTPDKDGINDFLFAIGHDLASFEWWIYNRWGEEVYYSNDISMPWDGSYKNAEHYVPDGVYVYRLVAWGRRDNLIEKEGSVLIIR